MPGSWRKQRLERLLAATGSRGTLSTLSASGWCLEVGPRAGNRARKRKWVLDQQLKATTTPCLKGSAAAVVWSEAKLPSLSTSAAAAKLFRQSSVQARTYRPLFMASSVSDERVVGDRLRLPSSDSLTKGCCCYLQQWVAVSCALCLVWTVEERQSKIGRLSVVRVGCRKRRRWRAGRAPLAWSPPRQRQRGACLAPCADAPQACR